MNEEPVIVSALANEESNNPNNPNNPHLQWKISCQTSFKI